jgi:DNA-binding transcriptional regulator YdaS (Cro superfamily)
MYKGKGTESMKQAVVRAIAYFGSQGGMANALNADGAGLGFAEIKAHNISDWLNKLGYVPAHDQLCLRIERLTEGKVSRYELRPDVFGSAE